MGTIRIETDADGVAKLTLARGEKRNAMSGEMIGELAEAARRLASDTAVRVVVLAGEGKAFCAGGDLAWMQAQMQADTETRRREAMALAEMLNAMNTLPKPVIARVHGDAFGGGVGLMAISDMVVAAEGTRFGLTETRLGLIPATIGPYVIARMGEGRARRVFMSSRMFGAEEAAELGLIGRIVAPEALDAAVADEVRPYLVCAPGAIAEAKALALRLGGAVSAEDITHSVEALLKRWDSEEAVEGTSAFFEKRAASWVSGG